MRTAGPIKTDIVLLGGGHAHVHVLAAFAKHPEPGVRLTLVTRDLETPYSGMLPGVIAGLYRTAEAHIDLVKLSAATGVRLIHAEAIGLDRTQKRVVLNGRPPVAYDLVSVDVGITPALDAIMGASERAIAVKPIGSFLGKFSALLAEVRKPGGPRRIVVIGGGAGGVELLLSVRARLLAEATGHGTHGAPFTFCLVTDGEVLISHNERVRLAFRRVFRERGIDLHEHARATAVHDDSVELSDGRTIPADCVLVTTGAAAPGWFAATGLARDQGGFLAVGPTLQSLNDPNVFAVGDCAALVETPREKAGVYAVRAGPPLAQNLRLRARNNPLKPWRPQRRHLALISTGERYALASRGWFKAEGGWLWTVKDWIDRRWMRMYQDVEGMTAQMSRHSVAVTNSTTGDDMRCGGCAAKIGPGPLSQALARVGWRPADGIVIGLDAPDDAAVTFAPRDAHLVQTVDFFRSFIDDPYVFGEVAANHALNDIFAMGGTPRHALVTAVVPYGPSSKMEEDLFQVLAGVQTCLDREGVALVGGHSSEGAELSVGLSVTGDVAPDRILRKGGLRKGDALVLTKPLGTGILFAASMRAKADASWIEAALSEMRRSNRQAAQILVQHGATAMTDVTGFGLVGHLGEMLAASRAAASLDLAAVPLYRGTIALARAGFASTLLPENLASGNLLSDDADPSTQAILFDPQTAGGFLAGIPQAIAEDCVQALRNGGYGCACVIGEVTDDGFATAAGVHIGLRGSLTEQSGLTWLNCNGTTAR